MFGKKKRNKSVVSETTNISRFSSDELAVLEAFIKKPQQALVEDLIMGYERMDDMPDMKIVTSNLIKKIQNMPEEEYDDLEMMILKDNVDK